MQDDILPAAGDEAVRAEDGAGEAPGTFEIEVDGVSHEVPAALKGAFLRQADYTRKTQELAEHRRLIEAEREALAQQSAAHEGAGRGRIQLAALDHQLAAFEGVDWNAYAAQDPQGAEQLWARFQGLAQAREHLAQALAHHDEKSELAAAREAAEAMAATGRQLSEEIEGWSPEVAAKLVDYAQAFGVTVEELAQVADPRLWKLLHKAWRADQAEQRETQTQAQAVRPAVVVAGGGAGGGMRDELSTKEWMRRRNEQMRKGR